MLKHSYVRDSVQPSQTLTVFFALPAIASNPRTCSFYLDLIRSANNKRLAAPNILGMRILTRVYSILVQISQDRLWPYLLVPRACFSPPIQMPNGFPGLRAWPFKSICSPAPYSSATGTMSSRVDLPQLNPFAFSPRPITVSLAVRSMPPAPSCRVSFSTSWLAALRLSPPANSVS